MTRPRPGLAAAFAAAVEQVRPGSTVGRAFAAIADRDPDVLLALARAKLDIIAHFADAPTPTDEDDARDD